ncbi:tRNA (adenosine(37)-N6)-dimethylallyltransferase MiaA [Alkalinema sp. FACHB-956]|uniref:tRNA (adenosine(37)-N6)-dimethylallyltransferase MiaA n=1 Tax=Alkalinema sp. FACHB-956 TaxID=2692768 RepID=UPI0016833C52|nr:tRNA (adenosine(37)-N6)-dimethylallyltransferase MiaA [Alkalinema sp. FACHB-956]MBD2325989.1 tRNA (adenosine(37)-N6)-dimethylallyltransferase MiaA [Alkalinema sp. FACHB-956]
MTGIDSAQLPSIDAPENQLGQPRSHDRSHRLFSNAIVPDLEVPNWIVPGLLVICGATASGKSGLAIAIAQRLNSLIISADSRQVYREFSIGTAKPSIEDQKQVPHALIDVCDPTETLTVADFQARVNQVLTDWGRSHPTPWPLLVGGTGLYIKSITRGMQIPRVAPQPQLRSQLVNLGQPWCYALLQQVDPIAATKIHANDTVRTLRALEVYYVTGHPITEQQGEHPPAYPILQIGLESAQIDDRIRCRTQQMFAQGFGEEVKQLVEKYGDALPLLNTLGYQEVRQYLQGKISLTEAEDLTVLHTRQFAKRQRTWFRAYPEVEWFDADAPDLVEQVWQRVQGFMTQANTQTNTPTNASTNPAI